MNLQSSSSPSERRSPRAWLLLTLTALGLAAGVRSAVAGTAMGDDPIAPVEPGYHFQRDLRAQLAEAGSRIGAVQARQEFSVDGTGLTAAVLDTGIRSTHVDFAGKILEQHNYTDDYGGAPANAADGNGHGTNVSGIIAANSVHTGIAPGAKIVAMKVLDNEGNGDFAYVEAALQYLLDNHSRLNITVANLSLGSNQNLSVPTSELMRTRIAQLRAEKVAIVVSAGNAFYTFGSVQGMARPAIFPETVSVGATYDANYSTSFFYGSGAAAGSPIVADQFCPFSQRLHSSVSALPSTDIFAPGAAITASGITSDTGSSTYHGTSQAAPTIAGTILLMQQYHLRLTGQLPSVDDIEDWLVAGAVTLTDSSSQVDNVVNTGLQFPRVNVLGTLQAMRADLGGEGNLSGRITSAGAGLEGVTVSIGGQTTLTDASGNYAFTGLASGTFTVIPSKPPFVFTPTSRTVNVQPNASDVDFAAVTYTIKGAVKEGAKGVAGATVTAGSQSTTTATNGTYTLANLEPGTYGVSVAKEGYKLPAAATQVTVGPSRTNVNFAVAKLHSVSGKVTVNKIGLAGVTVTLQHTSGNRTATTAANGTYTFADVVAGSYKVAPTLAGYLLTPASRPVRVITKPVVNVNFTGAVIPDLTDLTLTAASVKGTRPATATVVFNGKAPALMKVTLLSSNPALAKTPLFVNVPKGRTSASFRITTKKVLTPTPVTISATINSVTKTVVLTLTP